MKPVQLLDFDSVQEIVWAVSYPLNVYCFATLREAIRSPEFCLLSTPEFCRDQLTSWGFEGLLIS